MDFEIPKIYKEIEMKEYAPEFGDAKISVWVNPQRSILDQINDAIANFNAEKIGDTTKLIATLWSCEPDEVTKLVDHSADTDPALFQWCILRTFSLIREHRSTLKKNWTWE